MKSLQTAAAEALQRLNAVYGKGNVEDVCVLQNGTGTFSQAIRVSQYGYGRPKRLTFRYTTLPQKRQMTVRALRRTITISREDDERNLWHADPDCEHNVVGVSGGGVKCTKCSGWFCY